MMRSTHPYLFQRVNAKKRKTDLHCEGRYKVFHPYMQSTLDIDVSLHGGIPPGRPPDQEMMRDASHLVAPLIDSGGVRTLGELEKNKESGLGSRRRETFSQYQYYPLSPNILR